MFWDIELLRAEPLISADLVADFPTEHSSTTHYLVVDTRMVWLPASSWFHQRFP